MDNGTLTAIVALYVVELPLCFMFATIGVLSLGLLTRRQDQPIGMRVFTWMWPEHPPAIHPFGLVLAMTVLAMATIPTGITLIHPSTAGASISWSWCTSFSSPSG